MAIGKRGAAVRAIATVKSALVLSFICTGMSGSASAQSFNQFVGFGDSNIDSGFYKVLASPGAGDPDFNALWPSAVAHGAGKPTTSPGLMNSEALAAYFGLNALPSNQGGSNYSTSGAKNVTVNTARDRRIPSGDSRRSCRSPITSRPTAGTPTPMRSI